MTENSCVAGSIPVLGQIFFENLACNWIMKKFDFGHRTSMENSKTRGGLHPGLLGWGWYSKKSWSVFEANLTDTDLLGTTFHQCNLTKSDFRNAKNYMIDLQTNNVKNAQFSLPEAMNLLQSFDIILSWNGIQPVPSLQRKSDSRRHGIVSYGLRCKKPKGKPEDKESNMTPAHIEMMLSILIHSAPWIFLRSIT